MSINEKITSGFSIFIKKTVRTTYYEEFCINPRINFENRKKYYKIRKF